MNVQVVSCHYKLCPEIPKNVRANKLEDNMTYFDDEVTKQEETTETTPEVAEETPATEQATETPAE